MTQLQMLAFAIEALRMDTLFSDTNELDKLASEEASQFYILALGALDAATRYTKLADLAERRATP